MAITIVVEAGRTLGDQEEIDNDKLNDMAVPIVTAEGGNDVESTQYNDWWLLDNASSTVNAYKGRVPDEGADPDSLVDGLLVEFAIPATLTNTGAAVFELQKNDGTVLGSAAILKRGRAVIAGDLVAGRKYSLRYSSGLGGWELKDTAQVEGSDIPPGAIWFGTNNASTATAYVMQFTPAPASLAAGMKVRFPVPANNSGAVTLQVQNGAAAAIDTAKSLQMTRGDGSTGILGGGELRTGMMLELVYTGTVWMVTSLSLPPAVTASVGLVIQNNAGTPNTIVDVAADELVVRNGTGSARVVSFSATQVNIAVNGAGGLDTGAGANSTWYYLWVIVSNSGTISGLLSASATDPTMPTGYSHKALVGAVYRDSGGLFLRFFQHGRRVFYRSGGTLGQVFTGKSVAVINTYELLAGADLTAFRALVPSIAKVVHGTAGGSLTGAGGASIAIAADANGLGAAMLNIPEGDSWDGTYAAAAFTVPMTTHNLYWKSGLDTEAQNFMRVTGWEF